MKKISKQITFVVILASLVLTACQPKPAPATSVLPAAPSLEPTATLPAPAASPTVMPSAIPPTKTVVATFVPTNPPAQVVVTATGMADLGSVLTPQLTAIAEGVIDWDLGAHPWKIGPGLVAQEVKYMDTGVLGDDMVLDTTMVLPDHMVLICGGTDAKIELVNGFSLAHGGGFYFVLLPHTQIKSLWLQNGFCLFVDEGQSQDEFAARVAQAISSNWAYGHVYQPEEWPALTGTYSTPLNSNR